MMVQGWAPTLAVNLCPKTSRTTKPTELICSAVFHMQNPAFSTSYRHCGGKFISDCMPQTDFYSKGKQRNYLRFLSTGITQCFKMAFYCFGS